ncbi:MAG TPA: BON domain-containing protein, partial [Longimicrobiaceae bacterium]|nr:BON domain-containing protein [Longimicrobiaceae bacterium]
ITADEEVRMPYYDRGFGPSRGAGSMGGRRSGAYDRTVGAWWGYGRDYGRGAYGGGYPEYGGYPGSGREGMYYGGGQVGGGGGDRYSSGGRPGGYGYGGGMRGGSAPGRGRPHVGRPWHPERYDTGYMGGYTRGYDRGIISERVERTSRYDAGFAREPFMPEAAYLRHPEYDRPPSFHQERWEQPGRYQIHREKMSDEEIQQEVRQRLYQDSWLHADEIEVDVREGVVTLRGEVGDFLEARYAWDDAWETEGVRGVINNLTVRTDVPAEETHGDMFAQDAGDDSAGRGS